MNDDYKREKVIRFVNDEGMSKAVFEVVRDSFFSRKDARDIQILAAERLAIDLLRKAWGDMERLRDEVVKETPVLKQVGL